tara:strand:+ start:407 stop:1366 length:960 start_codon:yes stop_codon:yes gene_type:complete
MATKEHIAKREHELKKEDEKIELGGTIPVGEGPASIYKELGERYEGDVVYNFLGAEAFVNPTQVISNELTNLVDEIPLDDYLNAIKLIAGYEHGDEYVTNILDDMLPEIFKGETAGDAIKNLLDDEKTVLFGFEKNIAGHTSRLQFQEFPPAFTDDMTSASGQFRPAEYRNVFSMLMHDLGFYSKPDTIMFEDRKKSKSVYGWEPEELDNAELYRDRKKEVENLQTILHEFGHSVSSADYRELKFGDKVVLSGGKGHQSKFGEDEPGVYTSKQDMYRNPDIGNEAIYTNLISKNIDLEHYYQTGELIKPNSENASLVKP